MSINILDNETINKIAAGEVVERPSAVVKELIENSIDAESTAITIDIKDGGISFIRVTDDGCGITDEDLPYVFQRHCTSKLKKIEDLDIITTLGFRGEALSSISVVSQVEIITKRKENALGKRMYLEAGKVIEDEYIGSADGTTVVVKNLFFNTPARKKFLKSNSSEAAQIINIVEKIALAHPEISIKLYVNGKLRLSTSGNNKLKDVIYTIYGKEIAQNLISVDMEFYNMKIRGYIASPLISKNSRSLENYFVNGRYIKNYGINNAIESGFFGRMMTGQFPFSCIYIDIAPDMINVNIHPAKMEIRFNNETELFNIISDSIKEALRTSDIIPDIKVNDNQEIKFKDYNSMVSFAEPFEFNSRKFEIEDKPKYKTESIGKQINIFDYVPKEKEKNIKILGQVFGTYWLIEFEETLFIMDQHAAHEKVLFEKFLLEFKSKNIATQELLIPIQVNLNSIELDKVLKLIPELLSIGFDIEQYSNNSIIVRAVPYNMYKLNIKELVEDIIKDISLDKSLSTNEKIYISIATKACKAAIKGNNIISEEEIKTLVKEMLELDNPYQCPHGRPTVIRMTKRELEVKFARIV